MSWNAPLDPQGVVIYSIFVDGEERYSNETRSANITGIICEDPHCLALNSIASIFLFLLIQFNGLKFKPPELELSINRMHLECRGVVQHTTARSCLRRSIRH